MLYKFSKIVAKLRLLGNLQSTKSCLLHYPHILSATGKDFLIFTKGSSQFSSVQLLSCIQLCDPMNCSTPDRRPVHHQLLVSTQTHVH